MGYNFWNPDCSNTDCSNTDCSMTGCSTTYCYIADCYNTVCIKQFCIITECFITDCSHADCSNTFKCQSPSCDEKVLILIQHLTIKPTQKSFCNSAFSILQNIDIFCWAEINTMATNRSKTRRCQKNYLPRFHLIQLFTFWCQEIGSTTLDHQQPKVTK